jgi:hypothetical protein
MMRETRMKEGNAVSKQVLRKFCRQVRSRSSENQAAFQILTSAELHAPAIGLLRQELDSMIRVVYLLELNAAERFRLIDDSVNGVETTDYMRKECPRHRQRNGRHRRANEWLGELGLQVRITLDSPDGLS